MRVGVLGPLLVLSGEREVTPRGQRLRDVLAVLLQRRGRSVPPDVVLDLVWGTESRDIPVTAVHTVVARLRRQLGSDAVQTHAAGYRVDPATTTDEDTFQEQVQLARRRLERQDWRAACAAYREALGHWRGRDAFDGVSDDLVAADRARLGDQWAAAAEDLARTLLDHPETGEPAEALQLATAVMERHPLRESACQLGMRAAVSAHRTADALALHRGLRDRLRTELGIDPSPATERVHAAILRGEAHRDPPSAARPAVARGAAAAATVPAPVTPLVGRADELAAAVELLDAGRRLITIVGPGGVGKSRLLLELGARRRSTGHTIFAEVGGLTDGSVDGIAEAITAAQGIAARDTTPLRALLSALGDEDWLLLVDEAESVTGPLGEFLSVVLAECLGVQAVVTSRRPLDRPGEFLFELAPLPCPAEDADPAGIAATDAVRLLVERLADRAVIAPRAESDPAAAGLLAEIARSVDGLPLALELIAGQASTHSLAELAALAGAPLDIAPVGQLRRGRHGSLRETFAWSADRVDAQHRVALHRLAVFVGRFDIAAARAVVGPLGAPDRGRPVDGGTDAVAAAVFALSRDALVSVDRSDADELGFRLLGTVREFALEAATAEDLAAARARHRRWHADRWRGDPPRDELLADVRDHREDFVQALRSAVEDRDAISLPPLALTLTRFWIFTGGHGVGLRWTGRVLSSGLLDEHEHARVLTQRAALAVHHDMSVVRDDTAAAIPVLQTHADHSWLITAHTVRAMGLDAAGSRAEAMASADSAVGLARRTGSGKLVETLGVQAMVHAGAGSAAQATAAIAEAERLLRASGSAAVRVIVCVDLACALLDLGRPTDALDLLDELSADVAQTLGPVPPAFFTLTSGWAALAGGRHRRALSTFRAELPAAGQARVDQVAVEASLGSAHALAALGHPVGPPAAVLGVELAARIGFAFAPGVRAACARAFRDPESIDPAAGFGQPTDRLATRLSGMLRPAVAALLDGPAPAPAEAAGR